MELEGSLSDLKAPAICPCTGPNQCSSFPHPTFEDSF